MEGEEITGGAAEERPALSFRELIERRLEALEGTALPGMAPRQVGDITDEEGNSLAGRVRVLEARMMQLETIQAENTSNILKMSELCQFQYAGVVARIAALEATLKPA
jgi:hypothetical protein